MCIFRPCVLVKLFVCIVVVNSTSPFTDDQHNPHSIASASSNRRARTWTQTATVQSADDGGSSDDEIAQQQLDNWETVVSHKHKTPAAQSFFRYKYADYAPSQRSNARIIHPRRQLGLRGNDIKLLCSGHLHGHFFYRENQLPSEFRQECEEHTIFTVQQYWGRPDGGANIADEQPGNV